MAGFKSVQANSAIIGIYSLLMTVFVLAALYFGQDIIIPLSLAILLTFLLSPIVTKMERWIGRIPAVLSIVVIIFIIACVMGDVLSQEFMDLTAQLPSYKGNIQTKLQSFPFLHNDFFSSLWQKIQNTPKSTIPEAVVNSSAITQTAQSVISTLIHIMVNIAFVMLLLIFMLLNREDLRGRIIRLLGQGHISATTLAMDDASERISHYLLMQLIINFSFGVTLTIGLFFIGIPNAVLWGGLLIVLRFIPYVGTWIAASIPILLSFIISASWMTPLFTISLYLLLDLVSTNFLEPYLYGASTGISSTALIIAAVFWTLLWGPIGLLLAIPLTVCLVVIGRHVPQLEFLNILLGDNKALEVHEECYNRLLTEGQNEGVLFVEKYLKENSLLSLYDSVLIPMLIKMENDLSIEALDPEKAQTLYQGVRDIIEDLNEIPILASAKTTPEQLEKTPSHENYRVLCVPAKDLRDEIAGEMLTQVLNQQTYSAESLPAGIKSQQILDMVERHNPDVILITVIFPSTLLHARNLCKKLRTRKIKSKIIICLLGSRKIENDIVEKILSAGADYTAVSLTEAVSQLESFSNEIISKN
jgi:predicted PurR-regulated permease PerM/CheY-like chemotaxis protein